MGNTHFDYKESVDYIAQRAGGPIPDTAVVLGSGLGAFTGGLADAVHIPYSEIPHFPLSTAPSHAGKLVIGSSGGRRILVMSGRFHYYEGLSPEEVTYYVRVLAVAGVKHLILTNAAGCINTSFHPGEFMLVNDHINFTGLSPCRGFNESELGKRFFDMCGAYSKRLLALAKSCADDIGLSVHSGVYAYMTGPQYETPAEIRALRILGADAVGMSTVPEVIEAAHCGLQTLCISCFTNYAAGMTGEEITAYEVIEAVNAAMPVFSNYLNAILSKL